ncbi:transcriptional corepressor LEUNIG-like isoform X2 [Apium graveolens]
MQRNGGRLTLEEILRMQTAVLILISSGVALLMTKTNSAPVMSLYFHPNNGDLICSCDSLDEIRYWSVKNGGCDRVLKISIPQHVRLISTWQA